MKVAYVTTFDILEEPPHEGGVVWSKRNLFLVQQVYGKENVYVCVITRNKKSLLKATGNITAFYSKRKKTDILLNSFSGRLQYNKSVENSVLKHILHLQCDVVCFDMSRMGFLQERLPEKIKQVLFLCGIERDYIKALININPSRIILKRAINVNERLAVKNSEIIITLNKRDSDGLMKYYNRNSNLVLPVTMDDSFVDCKTYKNDISSYSSSKLQLLFVGALFPPNEHGLSWFIREVMPKVNAELVVVGKDFEKLKSKLERDNVKIIGTAHDLSEYYYNSDAVVSPILLGEGMKVKTAGHLMYGKPMFATDEALEGYEVENIGSVFRCNTAEEFVSAINKFCANPNRERFDAPIRELFLSKYTTVNYIPVMKEILL